MKILLTLILGVFAMTGIAQTFLTPVTTLTGRSTATTADGRVISGQISMATMGPKGIMSFTIKDEVTGVKQKFTAEQVATLEVKMDGFAKMQTLSTQTSTVSRMGNSNMNEVKEREFIVYHSVAWPGNPGKFMLVQLLNDGWDEKIKVYDYPVRKTGTTTVGGIAVSGNEARAFIVKVGDDTMIVERNNYAKTFFTPLFQNCDKVMALPDKQKGFEDFNLHVWVNQTECE